jgi:hypothetical protein
MFAHGLAEATIRANDYFEVVGHNDITLTEVSGSFKIIVLLAIEPPVARLYILMVSAKFTTVTFYGIEASRAITRRTNAAKVELVIHLCHLKIDANP